jgi:hypothetical protein
MKKRTRLLNMIDKKHVNKPSREQLNESRVKDSVQEIIEEYENYEKRQAHERMMMM